MELISWNKDFETGIKEIDEQHRELVRYLNELWDAMRVGKGKSILAKIIDGLTTYTIKHFASEEKYMMIYAYANYEDHKKQHTQLVRDVKSVLKDDFNNDKKT
ncbi:MAG: hemerythrin family protein [Bacteroidales bacterium]|nr:hemerythrin family protein [Bacteroidales bacterium]